MNVRRAILPVNLPPFCPLAVGEVTCDTCPSLPFKAEYLVILGAAPETRVLNIVANHLELTLNDVGVPARMFQPHPRLTAFERLHSELREGCFSWLTQEEYDEAKRALTNYPSFPVVYPPQLLSLRIRGPFHGVAFLGTAVELS